MESEQLVSEKNVHLYAVQKCEIFHLILTKRWSEFFYEWKYQNILYISLV